MLFIRFASQLAFIDCAERDRVEEYFINKLEGIQKVYEEAAGEGDESSTVLFLKDKNELTDNISAEEVILLNRDIKFVMKEIINCDIKNHIEKFELSPSILLMRYIHDWKKVYEELTENYKAEKIALQEAVKLNGEGNTIVALTSKPLHRSVKPVDLIDPPVVIGMSPTDLYKELRDDVLIYLAKTTGDKNWYELTVSIYSKDGRYKDNYNRVCQVLNELEVGLVLNEGWTVDHPFIMVTVAVYQLTLLSLFNPVEIKKILLGLEYNSNGERIVDLDLYYKKKKISWTEREIKKHGKNRTEVGMYFRNELIKRLPEAAVKRYLDLK